MHEGLEDIQRRENEKGFEKDRLRSCLAEQNVERQPMFCLETAVKLLTFSWAVYGSTGEAEQQSTALKEADSSPSEAKGSSLEKNQAGAGLEEEGVRKSALPKKAARHPEHDVSTGSASSLEAKLSKGMKSLDRERSKQAGSKQREKV